MKLVIVAGASSVGKTAVIKQMIKNIPLTKALVKLDITKTFEAEEIKDIPVKVVYTYDLCPDHASALVLGEAVEWAGNKELLIVESAGLCLRCSPYVNQGVGVVVMNSSAGMNTPLKYSVMLALADIAVVTKTDMISQAEKEVFRQRVNTVAPKVKVCETNALVGNGLQGLYRYIINSMDIDKDNLELKGMPPLATCTLCVGQKKIGWQNHYGLVRTLDVEHIYRGE